MKNETLKKLYGFIKLVFKAVGTAMGVAVVVLSIMGKLDVNTAIMLLGIGVAGTGIAALMTNSDKE
ncbi:MAG: hypothetical protein Q4B92_04720 [Ruminococcus sp.]|nr:hypothetical protein [Ruminococcus sp.]MDO4419649.1 hypothetical protein [Ruminococcus sp.]